MPVRNRRGGLHRGGTLFDTNVPATSIDKDIFTDQEVESTIADDDLILMLDVSEDPDVIKYMTRSNFTAGLTGSQITVSDNESTDESNLVTFVAGAATATGLQSIEMDGDFHYNPSTGRLTATQLAGTLQTASQTNITAVGTIATGTWEGTTVAVAQGGTGATSLTNLITLATHTTGDYVQNITAGTGLTSSGATSGENIAHSLSVDASQTQITGVGTITAGTWEGTTVAIAQGGTGATSLNNLITMGTHTAGNYVAAITAGTGLTSTGATSGETISHSLSVDASQTQITAVGTIATGVWQGTDVGVSYGGPGASTATAGFDALSPMTAEGDILYGGSAGTVTKLAKGSDTQVLTLASGVPSWASPTTGDITGVDLTGGTNVNISSETGTTGGDYSSTINLDTSPTLTSSSANEPVLTLTNTHADATSGFIKFVKDPGSGQGADNDIIGTLTFHGTDASNNAAEELARMEAYVIEADHGSEAGGIKFYVAENDATMTAGLQILGHASDNGEIDVTIGAGAASTTTIAGTLTMGSTAAMTNAGLVSVANQSGITGVGTISSGTWEGTTVAVAQGGTGATSLSNLITLESHTTGDYVQNITAGTGLTSSGATSGENIAHSLSVDASQTQITAVGTIATGVWEATDVAVLHGGTGASTATAGFDALSPMTTQGDILYGGSSGTVTRLAAGSDNQTLMMNGTSPNWETVTEGVTAGFSIAMAVAL